jgi:hypothetical protein
MGEEKLLKQFLLSKPLLTRLKPGVDERMARIRL